MDEQRLDKWLWCTRFYKTRGLAAGAVKQGRVTLNGVRAKPARHVQIADDIVLRRPPFEYHLQVVGISKQRVTASKTGELYVETVESQQKRASLAQSIDNSAVSEDPRYGKLSKKDRRERDKLKRSL
jgi:ribosome-associated heat shock protein Hsp15